MLSAKIPTLCRRAVYERDSYACALCGRRDPIHVHHIKKRSAGGTNALTNLICLCPTCHAIAHGEYELKHQFPFDQATAQDAIHYYIEYLQPETADIKYLP